MLLLEIESLKDTFEQKTRHIVQEMNNEFNVSDVDIYFCRAVCVLEEIKAVNENFLSKIQNFLGTSNSNNDEEVEILNDYSVFNYDIEQQE